MRLAFALAAVLAFTTAAQARTPLTERQSQFLEGMAKSIEGSLARRHARTGARTFEPPKVTLDLPKRRLTIVNRFKQNPRGADRRAVKTALKDQQPELCLMFQSQALRKTDLSIVVRAELRSGSPIATVRASPKLCPQ